ncbi:lipopolysaccharide assembly protein LapB [Agarilytica rhodophyticola]|uniref:lipopolysaccharide assembly protein LapB n=1 Tax=Agarilytica rhodophyticola TaxID=1737490 RepID=UPI000B345774|nr:lipopolysaccharide assembly protein LapB [Agarilytica rhodophyticola]
MISIWLLIVIVLVATGLILSRSFFLGRNEDRKIFLSSQSPWVQERYIEGLTYLLNEQADEAVDHFISHMAVNADTLEVHLSLGNLLRKKGEIARAVKVHQNLLSHPNLVQQQLHFVQFELAKDYISSGLLDRAEILLCELNEQGGISLELRQSVLIALVEIYQDTLEWLKAIDIADQLTTNKFSSRLDQWKQAQAHYCCELAEQARNAKDWLQTRKWINAALRYNKNCVRASLLQAQLNMDDNNYTAAIVSLKKIATQNPHFASEMIQPLCECYQQLNSPVELKKELLIYLENHQDLSALNCLAESMVKHEGYKEFIQLLADIIPRFVDVDAAQQLVEVITNEENKMNSLYLHFKPVLDTLLKPVKKYQCSKCGFDGSYVHWLCPSCKSWESIYLLVADTEKIQS